MLFHPKHRNELSTRPNASAFSLSAQPDPDCEIFLIPADSPDHIPSDWEVWPIYQQAIIEALRNHDEALRAAQAAVEEKREELKGKRNRDLPAGYQPDWYRFYGTRPPGHRSSK